MKKLSLLQTAKREVALLLMLLVTAAVFAVPAKPGQSKLITLTDGTTVSATLVGDEFGHYWLGTDGRAYQALNGEEVYSVVDLQAVKQHASARRMAANQHRSKRLARRKVGEMGGITGEKKGLIILVNFKDTVFKESNDNDLFQRIANKKGFNEGDFKGSMYDYFYDQSDGQFELTFDVVGPVTVNQNQSYYGTNIGNVRGNDEHPAEMVIEALKKADPLVDYANYDWDGDKVVEQVYVVYAGKGEADGGAANTIWPHEWNLSSANYYGDGAGAQTLDGVTIDTYACGGELNGDGKIAGIGTMCHEFSHCLGYPDFYDTDDSGGQGMGAWDLMDYGSYNGNGYRPAGYTSYERWVAGWKEPIELETTLSVTNMKALTDGGDSYIIYNKGNNNEYYLLENRQKTSWDASIPGKGLLILHVDYDATVWADNEPNDDPDHQRMTWIPADNSYSLIGDAGDPFPNGSVNAFNKNTTPAAEFYNENSDGTYFMDSSVENITQNADSTISFLFKSQTNVATPKFSPAPGRYTEAQTVSISCSTEGAAIYYTLDGTTPSAGSTLYSQPIAISETTTVKAVAVLDGEESKVASAKYVISSSLLYEGVSEYDSESDSNLELSLDDEVLDYEGWATFNKVYAGGTGKTYTNGGCLKLGSNKAIGSLTTKAISLNGDATLTFWLKRYGTDTGQLNVTVNGAKADVTRFSPSATWTLCTVNLIRAQGSITITFSTTTKRAYLDEIELVPLPNSRQEISMAFSENSATAILGQGFMPPTLTISPEGLPVSYSSSNADVATVDSETGEVSILAVGTTVITASFAGNGDYYDNSASYTLTVTAPPTYFELVTDVTTLAEGDEVLIAYVSEDVQLAMGGQNNNNRSAVAVTLNADGTLTPSSDTQVIMLEKDGENFLFNVGTGYLYAASSTSNYMRTEEVADDNAKATIAISSGKATISFQGKNTRNTMRYNPNVNNNNPIFSCYASTSSTGSLPQIYRKVVLKGDVNGDGLVTIADVVALVNYLLDQTPEGFNERAAYVDDDDAITISDALAIVNIILNQ
ncbi:MAG: M6 family metalloprotease domain-containing protein [Prevotella sp.]|nr:M6 family metalloprotease domain-containing protein [Prevotella sp.]